MAVSVTRFADAMAALLAAYQGAAALAGIPVTSTVTPTAVAAADFVIVGHDASADGDGILQPAALAGTWLHEWSDTTTGQDERGWVNCLIACQSPDVTDVAGRLARAQVLLAAAEDAAAAAVVSHLTFDGTSDGRFITRQGAAGLAVICAYRVAYSAPWG
jgi:hypothetical protein